MLIINMIFINKHHSEQGHQKSDSVVSGGTIWSPVLVIYFIYFFLEIE